jgi:hypothetical protein
MKYLNSMLDYSKLVLERVSFHPLLFKKEYRKALKRLQPLEAAALSTWVRQHYMKSNLN